MCFFFRALIPSTCPVPEFPELTVVREVLERRVSGRLVASADVTPPGGAIVIRDMTGAGFAATLTGARIGPIRRRGKFLVFDLAAADGSPRFLVIHPKLTGRLQLAAPTERRMAKTCFVLGLEGGAELRYIDPKRMGQVYLTRDPPERAPIPDYAGLGPEPFDLTLDAFIAQLKPLRGEIKGALTRGDAVAGIGNAYADEILWAARIHPFRKRTTLTAEETRRLFDAMRTVLAEATAKVRAAMGENIHLEPRDFLSVHLRGGQPCPRCGATITEVTANQRVTSFCRACQPGGLIQGM